MKKLIYEYKGDSIWGQSTGIEASCHQTLCLKILNFPSAYNNLKIDVKLFSFDVCNKAKAIQGIADLNRINLLG